MQNKIHCIDCGVLCKHRVGNVWLAKNVEYYQCPVCLKKLLPRDTVIAVEEAHKRYQDILDFFAAPPTRRQRLIGFKNMAVHYILTVWGKIRRGE